MLINIYKFIKPVVSKNRFLKNLVIQYSQVFDVLPKVLTVALTYRCQCQCAHCGISDYRDPESQELSTEEVKKLIDDAKKIRSFVQVTFTGGEPLLRKDIFELIAHSKKRGFFTKIDSNAGMLDRDRLVKLKEAGLDRVGISIDHYDGKVHDKLREFPGLFQKVISAVRDCRELKISCYLQTYTTRQSLQNGDLHKTLTFAETLDVDKIKVQTPAIVGSFKNNNELILKHQDFVHLAEVISKHKMAYVESEVFTPLDYKKFCNVNFRSNIHITGYGDVVPCCWMPLSFGNIRKEALPVILKKMYGSAKFKSLLRRDGCLCSDPDFLKEHFGSAQCLPVCAAEKNNG